VLLHQKRRRNIFELLARVLTDLLTLSPAFRTSAVFEGDVVDDPLPRQARRQWLATVALGLRRGRLRSLRSWRHRLGDRRGQRSKTAINDAIRKGPRCTRCGNLPAIPTSERPSSISFAGRKTPRWRRGAFRSASREPGSNKLLRRVSDQHLPSPTINF
jgi:hypothetical protein